jgi:glycosyltransferase involved in cell wall biosynthesis
MHVVQVTPRYFPNAGGVETLVKGISETLVKLGVDVTVYSIDLRKGLPAHQVINGVLVKRYHPLIDDPLFLPSPRFLSDLRNEKAEIIHVHNIHTIPPLIAAMSKKDGQIILLQPHYHRFGQSAFRHSLLELYKHALKNIVFPRVNITIANSIYEQRTLREDFSTLRNVKLIPEGIDTNDVGKIRRHPEKPYRILYVGVLKNYKNVDKVINGFSYFLRQHAEMGKLVIVGDGPEYESLAEHAQNLGVEPYIEWKRKLSREQLLEEYARASAFILLSQLESFSRVVYEALLIGVPVVVLNFGAFKDLVRDGSAVGVNSLDPSEIATALSTASFGSGPRFSGKGRAYLEWQEYCKAIIDVYRQSMPERTMLNDV